MTKTEAQYFNEESYRTTLNVRFQEAFTYSNLAIETVERGMKYFQS